jgi:hypothetical protein
VNLRFGTLSPTSSHAGPNARAVCPMPSWPAASRPRSWNSGVVLLQMGHHAAAVPHARAGRDPKRRYIMATQTHPGRAAGTQAGPQRLGAEATDIHRQEGLPRCPSHHSQLSHDKLTASPTITTITTINIIRTQLHFNHLPAANRHLAQKNLS